MTEINPLSEEFYNARRKEIEKRVGTKRFKHIEGVADTAAALAEIYGVDIAKARLAGLLHDWDKAYSDDEARARIAELGMLDEVNPYVAENMPEVLHGPTAARALSMQFPEIPSDVIKAIKNHTTASTDPDDLEKVIYVADAIEPSRKFADAPALRDMVGKVSLDELFFEVYKFWTMVLIRQSRVLHPDTITIWNALAKKYRGA